MNFEISVHCRTDRENGMKITYIRHSGFLVELTNSTLLFDWWKGDLPEIDPEKDLYVFVSHSHEDHYSERIWTLRETYPVQYIVFEDVAPEQGDGHAQAGPGAAAGPGDILRVVPHQSYDLTGFGTDAAKLSDATGAGSAAGYGIHIETLLSTDQGVAFLVEAEGKTVYHAGDLNIWYWDNEPEEENQWQIKTYKEEMDRLRGKQIDAAFVPMDPRLGEHAVRAAVCFLEKNDCKALYPMHYWGRTKKIRAYMADPRLAPYADLIRTEQEPDGQDGSAF